jgi:hypothetical protein
MIPRSSSAKLANNCIWKRCSGVCLDRVDLKAVLQADETDSPAWQLVERGYAVNHRPEKPVELPHQQNVELVQAGVLE